MNERSADPPERVPTARRPWQGRRIVLGVTGGIAAYKVIQVARDLTRLGAEVDTVLTRGAQHFVTPLTFEGVTGRPVRTELFSTDGAAMHIRLGVEADVVCVAPATADFIARAARGRADDLLTTTLLATRAPVVLCPAMNDRMWSHTQTTRNAEHVRDVLGYRLVGPAVGPLAYGEGEGPGRMVEPDRIVEEVGRALALSERWRDRRVLITAGPTREPLDPVRYIGNRSSGRMGFALARAAWRRGAAVTVVSGPGSAPRPGDVEVVEVETAAGMAEAVDERIAEADVAIFAAAVADYRPADPAAGKIKRNGAEEAPTVELTENPDIAASTADRTKAGAVRVGFALETEDLVENARDKLERKDFDLIVANPAGEEDAGFDVDTNRVVILSREQDPEELGLQTKDEIAEEILDRIESRMEPDADGSAAEGDGAAEDS